MGIKIVKNNISIDELKKMAHERLINHRIIHKELASGKWRTLSLAEQMGNIGSEVSRARRWQGKDEKLFQNANTPKAFATVPHATHCFEEDGTEEKLFEETLQWFTGK